MSSKQPAESTRPGGGVRGFGKRKRTTTHTEIEPTFGSRLRAFLPVAALPNGIVVMVAIVFALIALIATSSPMAALPSTIAQFWLVVNMVPVHGGGHVIGYLPMLPAALLAVVVAKRVYSLVKERVSLADLGVLFLCVLLLPILLSLTAVAMLYDASVVYPVGVPNIAQAISMTALLHGSAFIAGMGRRLWRAILKRFSLPTWLVDSSLLATRGLAVIGAVSLAGVIISMAIHYRAVGDSLDSYNSALGVIGAIAVSVLYAPNAIVAAGAMLAGAEFRFGEGLFSLFGVNMVPLPPAPLLGALPASAHPWAAGLLVVTAVCVVYVVYRNVPSFTTGLVAAAFAGLYALVLCVFASGTLGVYGTVGPNLWMTSGFIAAWFAIVIVLAVAVVALISRRVASGVTDDDDYAEAARESDLTTEDQAAEEEPSGVAELEAEADPEDAEAGELSEDDFEVHVSEHEPAEVEEVPADAEPAEEHSVDASKDEAQVDESSLSDDFDNEAVEGLEKAPALSRDTLGEDNELDVDSPTEVEDGGDQLRKPETVIDSDDVEAELANDSWHADAFSENGEDPLVEEDSTEVAHAIQQEAVEEYESNGMQLSEPAATSNEGTSESKSKKKKRRRGGIFRRK